VGLANASEYQQRLKVVTTDRTQLRKSLKPSRVYDRNIAIILYSADHETTLMTIFKTSLIIVSPVVVADMESFMTKRRCFFYK